MFSAARLSIAALLLGALAACGGGKPEDEAIAAQRSETFALTTGVGWTRPVAPTSGASELICPVGTRAVVEAHLRWDTSPLAGAAMMSASLVAFADGTEVARTDIDFRGGEVTFRLLAGFGSDGVRFSSGWIAGPFAGLMTVDNQSLTLTTMCIIA